MKVKCRSTGEFGDSKDFYCALINGKNVYFKTEEIARKYISDKEIYDSLNKELLEIMNLQYSNLLKKFLNEFHIKYPLEAIKQVIEKNKTAMLSVFNGKMLGATEYQKCRYIYVVIQNNILVEYRNYISKQKQTSKINAPSTNLEKPKALYLRQIEAVKPKIDISNLIDDEEL